MSAVEKPQTPQTKKLPPLGQKKQNLQNIFQAKVDSLMSGTIQSINNRATSRYNSTQRIGKISSNSPPQKRKSFEQMEIQIHQDSQLLNHDFSIKKIQKVPYNQNTPSTNDSASYDENNINFLDNNLSSLKENNVSIKIFGESNSKFNSIDDSLKKNSICKECSNQITENEINLTCSDHFHHQCFEQIVETQLGLMQLNGLKCLCGKVIPSKMLYNLPKHLERILFKFQLKKITTTQKKKLFQCNYCDFFGVYQANLGTKTYCPNCEIKMQIL